MTPNPCAPNSSAIVAVACHVPEGRLTQETLEQRFGSDIVARIATSSGISERRVTTDECASDLAFLAAEALLERNAIDRKSIDLLIFATQTPDYLIPTTACILPGPPETE